MEDVEVWRWVYPSKTAMMVFHVGFGRMFPSSSRYISSSRIMYLIIGALLELVLSEDIVICGESNSARSKLGCVELVKLVTFIFSCEFESLLLRN